MKNILITLILSLFTILAYSQTPFDIVSSHQSGIEASRFEISSAKSSSNSLKNPWVGAKLAYNVSGDVSESFLLSARVLYVVASGDRYAFPVVGNVGLTPDTLNSNAGVSFGVFPYYILSGAGNLQLLVHGGLNYHILNKGQAGANTEFRALAGLEAALYPQGDGSPTTISVAPEYVLNIGNTGSSWGLSVTGVVPVANGLGILIDGKIPFNQDTGYKGFSIGVIVNSPID